MRELVIVVSDLYVSQERPGELPDGVILPGLQHVVRFGTRLPLSSDWRSWLARWLREGEAAQAAPATVAANGAMRPVTHTRELDGRPLTSVWMATPVHLVAGLTSLHLDRRSLLRLEPDDLETLTSGFGRDFHDSGFSLVPLETGDLLLFGAGASGGPRPEPGRLMGNNVADAHQNSTAQDRTLRRLGAEVEMWLHEHAVNDARKRRGQPAVTGLWFWGGGPVPSAGPAAGAESVSTASSTAAESDIAFGRDAYVNGLWATVGQQVHPVPRAVTEIFSYPRAQRAVLVLELGAMLHSNPAWTFFDALARVDRDFITPAIDALSAGQLERLVIVANDHELALRARDRLKVWRRPRPGLSGLK